MTEPTYLAIFAVLELGVVPTLGGTLRIWVAVLSVSEPTILSPLAISKLGEMPAPFLNWALRNQAWPPGLGFPRCFPF